MKSVKISVIIPIYNVEEFLRPCLDSVAKQNIGSVKDGIEVIIINDGSTDNSGKIAFDYAQKYSFFKYYEISNKGVGYVRNYGVSLANGEYIAFLDSDDMLVTGIYNAMYNLAQKTSSDLTICNVLRFNSKREWKSNLQEKAFKNIKTVTHITENTNLIYDTTVWNKLIKRDFYLKHNIKFPENIMYEDIPVSFKLHYYADKTSVIKNYGYLWRVRDGATKSITQNASDFTNFSDRLKILKMFDKFFAENVKEKELYEAKLIKYLEVDLRIFINTCINLQSNHQKIIDETRDFIKDYDPAIFKKISVINQAKYSCVLNGDTDTLMELLSFESSHYKSLKAYAEDGDFKVDFPEKYSSLICNNSILNETVKSEIKRFAPKISARRQGIEITAYLYYDRCNTANLGEQKIKAFLYNESSDSRLELEVEYFKNTDLTQSKGFLTDTYNRKVNNYNYDATGFKIIFDPYKTELGNDFVGRNNILIEYENRIDSGSLFLEGAPMSEIKRCDDYGYVLDGKTLATFTFSHNQGIAIDVSRDNIFAKNIDFADGDIALELEQSVDCVFAKSDDGEIIKFSCESSDNGRYVASFADFKREKTYSVFAEIGSEQKNILSEESRTKVINSKNGILNICSNRTHKIKLTSYNAVAKIKDAQESGNTLLLKCKSVEKFTASNKPESAALFVLNELSYSKIILAKSDCEVVNGKAFTEFKIDFNLKSITENLSRGIRDIFIEYRKEDKIIGESKLFRMKHLLFSFETFGIAADIYTSSFGILRLKSQSTDKELAGNEEKLKAFAMTEYPKLREKPIDSRKIVFESMQGIKYGGNPRALYEYINANYPEFECIWLLNDEHTPINGNAKRVQKGTEEYFDALATAKYFVSDAVSDDNFVKRDGQILLQAALGTPVKTIGLDVDSIFKTDEQKSEYTAKCRNWDYFVTQGEFVKEKAKNVFDFQGRILSSGYPKTDLFFSDDKNKNALIREKLNIPNDKKVILYMPTWRIKKHFDMRLDIDKMREKLGDEYILVICMHPFCAGGYKPFADNSFVFDMSKYQNIEELCIASDILITDYSSIMFDYLHLGKPVIFYAYDLDDYKIKRGLYADYENEMPGAVVSDTDSVIEAVNDSYNSAEKYKAEIRAIKKKYMGFEKANSSKAVTKAVFAKEIKKIRKERLLGFFNGNKKD